MRGFLLIQTFLNNILTSIAKKLPDRKLGTRLGFPRFEISVIFPKFLNLTCLVTQHMVS